MGEQTMEVSICSESQRPKAAAVGDEENAWANAAETALATAASARPRSPVELGAAEDVENAAESAVAKPQKVAGMPRSPVRLGAAGDVANEAERAAAKAQELAGMPVH